MQSAADNAFCPPRNLLGTNLSSVQDQGSSTLRGRGAMGVHRAHARTVRQTVAPPRKALGDHLECGRSARLVG
jgi:hypothetical protein